MVAIAIVNRRNFLARFDETAGRVRIGICLVQHVSCHQDQIRFLLRDQLHKRPVVRIKRHISMKIRQVNDPDIFRYVRRHLIMCNRQLCGTSCGMEFRQHQQQNQYDSKQHP